MISLPIEVQAVFQHFRTCELTTFSSDGAPVTWPVSALYQPEHLRFLFTTSIGFAKKAFNIRRNPKVAMLYSDPTGSGLESPPAVLVQGEGSVSGHFVTAVEGLEDYWRETIFRRQPSTGFFSSNFITRWLMGWNFMRLIIHVAPRRILWWPGGDFSRPPEIIQTAYVEAAS